MLNTDLMVVCAGYESNYFMRKVGIKVPLIACKAYSLDIRNVDIAKHLYYAAFADYKTVCLITPYTDSSPEMSIRLTGIRDLDGCNPLIRQKRLRDLIDGANHYLGEGIEYPSELGMDSYSSI